MADLETGIAEAAPEQGPSVTDTLGAVFDRMQASEAPEAPVTTEAPAAPVAGQPRHPDGKYAPKTEAAAPAAPAVETKIETPATPTTEQPGAPAKASAPPVSWSADAKATWATLPPTVQAEIAKREAEVTRGFTEKGEEAKRASELYAALEPVKAELGVRGLTPAAYVRQLVQADAELKTNFPQAIRAIAQMYGHDLDRLFATQPGPTAQPGATAPTLSDDPTVAALQQKVAAWESQAAAAKEQQARASLDAAQRQIEDFRNAKDASGSPLYPHYDLVEAHMIGLMQAEGHRDLKKAYEDAVWARPEIRASLLAQQQAQAEAARQAENAKRAKEALRSAGVNVAGRGTTAGSPVTPPSVKDTLAAAYDASQAA